MKKRICAYFALCIALMLSGCGSKEVKTDKTDTIVEQNTDKKDVSDEKNEVKEEQSAEPSLYESEFFTLEFSEIWDDKYDVNYGTDNGLMYWSIYLKKDITGTDDMGYLFSVEMLEEGISYDDYPEYQYYGLVKFEDLGTYNILFAFPTDVESTEQCVDIYNELFADRFNVIDTFTLKEPYDGAVTILSNEEVEELAEPIPELNYTCSLFYDGKFHVAENDCFEIMEPPSDYTSGYGLAYGEELKFYFANQSKEIYGIDAEENIYTISKNLFSVDITIGEILEGIFHTRGIPPKIMEIEEKPEGAYGGLYYLWKIDNGYLIMHTWGGKSDFRMNKAMDYTLVSDAKYCSLIGSRDVANSNISTANGYTENELCELAKQYYCLMNGQTPPIVEVDSVADDIVFIHMYEHMSDHDATWDWYYISKTTGKGTNFMGDEIDLSSLPRD